jgi:hypothetical protein
LYIALKKRFGRQGQFTSAAPRPLAASVKRPQKMTIKQLVQDINSIENIYSVAFGKKIDGEFTRDSEVIIAEIDEESDEDAAKSVLQQNPDFSYFLELFLIKEMAENLQKDYDNIDKITDRIIHYAKYDA